jgi:type IV secretory pathway TrbD component
MAMRDRGDHYLSNNAWSSSGDGVPADNWELAGGRPRPSGSPALSPVPAKARPPAPRLLGSVKTNKPVTIVPKPSVPQASTTSATMTPTSASITTRSAKHRVYQALQQDKLLMGAERELSQINITITMVIALIALFQLSWHLALVALLFGGPVQAVIRIRSEDDPDYFKSYIQGLSRPHIRNPE